MASIFGTKTKATLEAAVEQDGDATFVHLSNAGTAATASSIEGTAFYDAQGNFVSLEFAKVEEDAE